MVGHYLDKLVLSRLLLAELKICNGTFEMSGKSNPKAVTSNLGSSAHFIAPRVVVNFLKEIIPFRELSDEQLQDIAKHCRVDFFPKGSRLMTADETVVNYLYLVQRGGVKAFLIGADGEEVLKDYRDQGSYIGALGIIRGTRANLNIETVEDTFCFLLPREIFLKLVKNNSSFAHCFLKSFSDQIVSTAYRELRHQKVRRRTSEDLYLFSICAGDVAKKAHRLSMECTIQYVAEQMAQLRIGSMLIHDTDDIENVVGIVTDTDFRMKVVAAGMEYDKPIKDIMSLPVQSVQAEDICFDVLLKMISTGIHHLAVEKGGRNVGVLTSHDIMVLQGNSPFYLFREIMKQREIEGLYSLARKVPEIIRNLIKEGGKAGNISRMISILNGHILQQLLALLEKEMGEPPVSYCWLLMGSEGRSEQTFITDQDNGIIYADPYSPEQKEKAEVYFKEFAAKAIEHLYKCGYPLCPGEIMASNPKWCKPFSAWIKYFNYWTTEATPEELLNASIFFDFRAGYGDKKLAVSLRNHIIDIVPRKDHFTFSLARQCFTNRVPLSFFNNFIVEQNGEQKNSLDIKLRGLIPIVGFARVLSLKYGLKETNTIARLQALEGEGYIPLDLCTSAVRAYELQMQFKIIHQLEQIERNVELDNFIEPANMTEMERAMLKDVFSVIEKTQVLLEKIFPKI